MVTVSIPSAVAIDAASNPNDAAQDFSIYYDPLPEMKIVPVITPGTQDDQNNVLVVEKIRYFSQNKLRLVNRWGDLIKEWENFQNYTSSSSEQADFNFMNLNQGSYIAILDYVNPVSGSNEKIVQMITVLK
jgi:hypothetical protein